MRVMSNKTVKQTKQNERNDEFVRKTVTLPEEVTEFAERQAARPEYAGNFSAYVRTLILQDRNQHLQLKPAA